MALECLEKIIMRREQVVENGLEAVRITGHDLALQIIPQLGGKISSLTWNGREVLARNPRKPFRLAQYAASFADYDASGFDECFPTIGPCRYPDTRMEVPDHGELWSIPWAEMPCESGLCLQARGVRFPYLFTRRIELPNAGHVRLLYEVTSLADEPFRCLWSAHPLLALHPGMIIHLPQGVSVRVDWSREGRLGQLLDEHPWPITNDSAGQTVDLSRILPESVGLVDKLYTTRMPQGWCALHDPSDGFYVAMLFSPQDIPYVGLSINLGGWPVEGPGYYNLGLEPCNGYPDRLDVAVERGDCVTLPARGSLRWQWNLFIGQSDDLVAELKRLGGLL
jgi:hypothetical protein